MAKMEKKEYTLMEGNLLEYPIFSMQQSRENRTSEEYVWQEKDLSGRIVVQQKFKIDCVKGVPNFFDMDVFNAVMRILVKSGKPYKENKIRFTIYQLIKELNLPIHQGSVVQRVRESLERMAKTSLHFENAFLVKKEKTSKIIHLIVRVEVYDKDKGDRLVNAIEVVLDDELINSIERKYFKLIDFGTYKSLSAGTPRRLYEYLEKKKYMKDKFEIGIKRLASWLGLKTGKISQLKGLFEKANNELKEKDVIDKWSFNKENIVYYFRKSESFKEVEEDLFFIENLVVTFYESLGQKKVSDTLKHEGMTVLQDLIDEGYSKEEVKDALSWAVDNVDGLYSIRVLPKVIGQALGAKESKELMKQKKRMEEEKRLEEEKKRKEEIKKEEELNQIFEKLPQKEKRGLEEIAKDNLTEQGVSPDFIVPGLLRCERNKILEQSLLSKKEITKR